MAPERPVRASGAWLTEQLRRAERHAENVSPLLEEAIREVLDAIGDQAARRFAAVAQPYGLTAAAPAATSTMIALKPTAPQAAALALEGGEPPEILHVTLAYLGETTGPLGRIVDALRPVAARHAALTGVVGGAGAFTDMGDGHPILALPDVPGLVELRVAVTQALTAAGIPYARDHGYCAHATLAYRPEPVVPVEALGLPLSFGELLVVRGDVEVVPLPLTGYPPLTADAARVKLHADRTWNRARVPIPGAPGWEADMRGVDALIDLLDAENVIAEIAAVAERHQPDEPAYGQAAYHAETRTVYWVTWDGTSVEEQDAAVADFLTIEGVDVVECEAEAALPDGDGWERVYTPRWATLAEVMAEPYRTNLRAAAGDPPPWGMPAPQEVIDVDAVVARITARTKPVRDAAIEAAATPVLNGVGIKWDVTNPLVSQAMAQVGSQVVDIAETTQLNVMRTIRRSYEKGLSIPHTAEAIREGMREASPARARLIARTELAGAVNGGSLAAVRIVEEATGVAYRKTWMTAPGAKHPRHYLYDGLNGQERKLAEKFQVGGAELDHPGDPEGPVREVANCRCTMTYVEVEAAATRSRAVGPRDTVSVGDSPAVPPEMVARITNLALDQWPPKMTPAARRLLRGHPNTESLYTKDGAWTEERVEVHKRIMAAHFDGKAAVAGKPTAYMTAGGSASGKSRAVFSVDGQDLPLSALRARTDVVHIDPDEIKKMLPEYQALRNAKDFNAASVVHEESSTIAKAVLNEAEKRGLSVILDTTGSSKGFMGKIAAVKKAGYDVQVTMFSVPTNQAIVRSMRRGDETGRYVAVAPLKYAHAGSAARMAEWTRSRQVAEWRVYDTTGDTAKLVAYGARGRITVLDEDAFARIKAKALELSEDA